MNANNSRSVGIENLSFQANNTRFVLIYDDPNANEIGKGIINALERGINRAKSEKDWIRGFRQIPSLVEKILKGEKP